MKKLAQLKKDLFAVCFQREVANFKNIGVKVDEYSLSLAHDYAMEYVKYVERYAKGQTEEQQVACYRYEIELKLNILAAA